MEARSGGGYHRYLHYGFSWLGGATVIAKAVDFIAILVVLLFLTKEQLGVASIVVAIGAVIEALNGFGTGTAVIRAPALSHLQLDTLFWLIIGAALLLGGATIAGAETIAALYKIPGMGIYFVAIAIKQPLVSATLIPLAIMNRDLEYKQIAIVNASATCVTALTRLGLAVAGTGVWAIVGAYAAGGFYVLVGVWLVRPFRPAFEFRIAVIVPLLRFGARVLASELLEQMFNNLHYLLVGGLYGASRLAVYRIAFTVAMEPAVAVGTLVNRTTLPVFARVATAEEHLTQVLTWSFGRAVAVIAPLMVAIILGAVPLTLLIHARGGASYEVAALPLMLFAVAAFLRVIAQLLYPLAFGSGHPGTAVSLSALMLVLSAAGVLGVGFLVPGSDGLAAIAIMWIAIYPPVLVWEMGYLRRHWGIRVNELVRTLYAPLVGVGFLVASVEGIRWLVGASGPRGGLGIVVAAAILTYIGLFVHYERSVRR